MFVIKCRRYCRGRRSLCSPTKHEIFISRETAYNPKDSENKLDVHCRAQTIVTIAFVFVVFFLITLAIVAPFFGTVFLVT